MKTCSKCNLEFPKTLEYFYKHRKGLHPSCKTCVKAYYLANPERAKATAKAHYLANQERKRKLAKSWSLANPDKRRAAINKRRALKLGNGHTPYTESEMLERYGTVCYLCNEEIDLKAPRSSGALGYEKSLWKEHVLALTNGGPDTLDNVKPSHAVCNQLKGTKEIYEIQMA
jgi:hypothetical protein